MDQEMKYEKELLETIRTILAETENDTASEYRKKFDVMNTNELLGYIGERPKGLLYAAEECCRRNESVRKIRELSGLSDLMIVSMDLIVKTERSIRLHEEDAEETAREMGFPESRIRDLSEGGK